MKIPFDQLRPVSELLEQFFAVPTIVKRYKQDGLSHTDPVTVLVCSMSPISNWAVVGSDGWIERKLTDGTFNYFENEAELFALHCKHNAWLAGIGFFDFDPATINFSRQTKTYFDKSACMRMEDITDKYIAAYFKLLNQSYKTIPAETQEHIRAALKTRNPEIMQSVFAAYDC